MSNVFHQFPAMFKSPPGENTVTGRSSSGAGISQAGQKVVCTPEVSLYQYQSKMSAAGGNHGDAALHRIMEETGMVGLDGSSRGGNPGGNTITSDGASVVPGPNGGFTCGFCGKTFQQKNTFQNHLRSHREGDDPYQCDICGKTFAVPARLTRHYRTHTGEKPYQCEYCNKSFSVKENLSVHRRIHTKERPYKCEVCERAFEHSGKLHRHMRIHTGERPHRCQICQKTFIQSGQLVIHMRTHTGEKPYVCKVCGKGFTCSKQLKVHTRTHTGEKPYTCDICGKSFGYNHVLKLHQVAHYGEKVYKCTLCNGTFNSKKALETHIKTHSEDNVPVGPGSPTIVTEPGVMSPVSHISHSAPPSQNSDKENRESSDSELSSQNSPSSLDGGSKTPPSPYVNTGMGSQLLKTAMPAGSSSHSSNNSNSSSNSSNSSRDKTSSLPMPYPMLPPGVQVQHGGTTFLYVTTPLPNTSSSSSSVSPPPKSPPLVRQPSHISPNGFPALSKTNAKHQAEQQLIAGLTKAASNSGENGCSNKLLMDKIREKVLQFTEKYGYSVSPAEREHLQQQQRYESSNGRYSGNNFHSMMVPENLTYNNNNRNYSDDYHQNQLRHVQQMKRERSSSSSPELGSEQIQSSYTPGGVLALALTKGSKAAAAVASGNSSQSYHHNIPAKVSIIPVANSPSSSPNGLFNGYHNSRLHQQLNNRLSPRSNSPTSPVDFHHHQQVQLQLQNQQHHQFYMRSGPGSVSPTRNSLHSPSPSSTPRSTPSLQDDYSDHDTHHKAGGGDSGDENSSSSSSSLLGKRSRSPNSNSSGGGARKRSSLILEKYAMENSPSHGDNSNESILSQRLRKSSVIQYAEKCS